MINEKQAKMYCKEDISLIENYEKAIADKTQTWLCHHRLETVDKFGNPREEEIPSSVLIDLRIYCNRPASELLFVTRSVHSSMHSKGNKHPWMADLASHPGKSNGMYGKSALAGKKAYNNGNIVRYFYEGQEEDGFIPGILQKTKDKISKNSARAKPLLGKKWYNNGKEEKHFVEGTQPIGWVLGRKPKKGDNQ